MDFCERVVHFTGVDFDILSNDKHALVFFNSCCLSCLMGLIRAKTIRHFVCP